MIGLLDGRLIAHAFAPLRKVARPSPAVCPHGDALRICGDCAREQREATA